jgi:16S rRNA (guanine527-N7)-methyltransferase
MHHAIRIHKELLQKWRKAMDLVGPGSLKPHFEDAQESVRDLHASGTWIDLGSGAGFPGIALAVFHPKAHVLLVESRQKRALFLQRVIQQSKLPNITLFHGRSEDITDTFDGVISRAYRKPLSYLEDARRLSKENTRTVLLLGGTNPFVTPKNWSIEEDSTYSISTGLRRRLILAAQKE